MGYSDSDATVQSILPFLGRLLQGEPCEWVFATSEETKRFAYKLREALNIAERDASKYPELARARQLYSIRWLRDEKIVRTVPRKAQFAPGGHGVSPVAVQPGAKYAGGMLTVPGRQTMMTIIESWLRRPAGTNKVSFTEAGVDDEAEALSLARWAATRVSEAEPNGWLVINNPPVLVLTAWDEDLADLAVGGA